MDRVRALLRHPLALWLAFVAVQLWLARENLTSATNPFGDVREVYRFWMDQAFVNDLWVGVDTVWVYPLAALLPMMLAYAFGPDAYPVTWLIMVGLLNAAAFGVLTGWGRRHLAIGWWWIGFSALLGPIAVGRIDSVTVPIAIVAVRLLATRPAVATALLALGAWIKIWPVAIVAAALIVLRDRARVLAAALGVTALVLLVGIAVGAGGTLLSFVTQQTGRALQPESPVATIWMWMARFGAPGTRVVYDRQILSFGVEGPGADAASAIMTPLMAVVVAAIALLAVLRVRAGVPTERLLPPLALAFTVALIAFNKVGSPQFVAWLAAPIVLGLLLQRRGFTVPAALALLIAALTQLIYPYLYDSLLSLDPVMLVVLTARNALELVLLGWAVRALWRAGPRQAVAAGSGAGARSGAGSSAASGGPGASGGLGVPRDSVVPGEMGVPRELRVPRELGAQGEASAPGGLRTPQDPGTPESARPA